MEPAETRSAVRRTEIPPPLFILGHWRSGTSLLQRLLAVDSRYAYPTSFEVVNPHTFLIREDRLSERLSRLPDRKRPMDEMILGFNSPGEDEMAVSLMSLRSPELGLSFPRRQEHYDRYLTFEGVPEADVARFRGAFLHFLRKLV
ncbi:MAG: sulfotransferase, partial [Bryobacterales bacterium]|nr:sulfotransferase [Bryobacterales bacterium]